VNIGQRISDGLALAGALLAFGFGTYLILVGTETRITTENGPTMTTVSPTPAGLVPLAIGALAIWAVARGRTNGFWLAAALATVCSVVFLFSISLQLAAIAAFLLLAVVVRTIAARDIQRR
jgi:hypothetical protein